jgi:BirA family transcriptional regulator, biotin operon repressor / biotin---[acetyl-CoA-carboxylase] ligase
MAPRVHRLERTPSTQDVLHQLATAGAAAGTMVIAGEQTVGRGSRGRPWASPVGGLWMSVLLRPAVAPALEVLSLRVAIAVSTAIEAVVPGIALLLKWPNDLVLSDRKLGGILCEARWQGNRLGWVTVGVGVNVANEIPKALSSSAIALATLVPGADPEPLIEPIAAAITALGDCQGYLTEAELASFRGRDWLAGKRLREPVMGTAGGVARDGALLLRRDDGVLQEVRSGSVLMVEG